MNKLMEKPANVKRKNPPVISTTPDGRFWVIQNENKMRGKAISRNAEGFKALQDILRRWES